MKKFDLYDDLLVEGKTKEKEEWTPPLAGAAISKHLGKSHVRGIVSDEAYGKHVKDHQHFPVFRVKKNSGDGFQNNFKTIRVGNTKGDSFVEYTVNKSGTVQRRTTYHRAEPGLHPGVRWSVGETWKIEDEQDKKKGKKK